MNDLIQDRLRQGEKILWSGKPSKIQLFEPPNNKSILTKWIVCAACLLLCFAYIPYGLSVGAGMSQIVTTIVIFAIFFAWLALSPIRDKKTLEKQTYYFVTNQRVFTCIKTSYLRVNERELSDVSEISVNILSTGNGDIVIGPRDPNTLKRARTSMYLRVTENKTIPMIFCSVEDPQTLLSYFPSDISVTSAA